jgi:hypothetical protein
MWLAFLIALLALSLILTSLRVAAWRRRYPELAPVAPRRNSRAAQQRWPRQ